MFLFQPKHDVCARPGALHLNNKDIAIMTDVKALRAFINEHMLWDSHTDYLWTKVSKVLGLLRKCYLLPVPQKLVLYNSLFKSHLRHCNLVWGTGTKNSSSNLVILQKNMQWQIYCIDLILLSPLQNFML